VAFDGHRSNDFTPYVFITQDYGRTFSSIASNLPTGGPDFVHVIREDPYNPNLLFLGTDVGAYVSTNRGGSWQKFMNGLPTVPVHDLKIHPRDHELIAGTHGRSIWIVDILPLEQMKDSLRDRTVALYAPKVAYEYGEPTVEGQEMGQFVFEAPSPAYGADIWYRLASGTPRGQTKITISDVTGDTIATVNGPASAGLHKVTWDFRGKAPKAVALSPSEKRDSVVQARRMVFVADSLEKAGTLPAPLVARIKTAAASGDQAALTQVFGFGRGGGGGRGAAAGGFQERPGEGPMPRAAGARGQQGAATEGGEAQGVDQNELRELAQLFRPPGSRGFGGFGGRGGAPTVGTGDYLVSMTVDGKKYTQVLHVERRSGADSGGFFGGDDDEEHEP